MALQKAEVQSSVTNMKFVAHKYAELVKYMTNIGESIPVGHMDHNL